MKFCCFQYIQIYVELKIQSILHFQHHKNEETYVLVNILWPPQALNNHNLPSESIYSFVLDISNEKNCIICSLHNWLISLITMSSRFIHVTAYIITIFFIQMDNILLLEYTSFCLSANGHLDNFHSLAIMNSADMNMLVWVLCRHMLSFPMCMYLRVELIVSLFHN